MKVFYSVTFKYSDDVYCSNIAYGEKETVEEHYKREYEWVSVKPAALYEVETAKLKGMPIIEL